jgi:toxin CptA
MSTARERTPLPILPRFSGRLAAFVVMTHLLAAASVLGLPAGPWRLLLIPVGASLAYQAWVVVLRRAPWSIHSVTWQADGTWTIAFVSGAETQARLTPATFISLPLVVINLRRGRWRRFALPVFADALDAEQLRRLRQRLRIDGLRRDQDDTSAIG